MLNVLFFQSDATPYGVTVDTVDIIVWRPALSILDGMPPWVVGLLNLRGQGVPVVDLALRMGHGRLPADPSQQLVLLRCGERRAALIVDRVDDLQELPESDFKAFSSESASSPDQASLPLRGEVCRNDELVMLLDAAALIAEIPGHPVIVAGFARAEPPPGLPGDTAARIFMERMHRLAMSSELSSADEKMDFAIVVTGRRRYAIKLEQIIEFGIQRNVTVIPGCPPCIVGCMNLRGEIVALVDLNRLLDGADIPQENQMVVLALDGKKVALRIRCVERTVQECPAAIILMHDAAAAHPMSLCMLREPQELTSILDVESLVDALRTS